MEIIIESKRKKNSNLSEMHQNFQIIDVTSKAEMPWVKFSPFYPHGNIPIPFSDNLFSMSVEGVWQGLKVFENFGIDKDKFEVSNMKNIKRSVNKYGNVKGHQKGIHSQEILNYITARLEIYIPSYNFVLKNFLKDELILLESIAKKDGLILLDYETNEDTFNIKKPLSHASLIKKFLFENYKK